MNNQNSTQIRNEPRKIVFGSQFKRDLKKHFLETATVAWAEVLNCLTQDMPLPEKYRDHALTGNWMSFRDCHIKPDLVLIYEKPDDVLLLVGYSRTVEFGLILASIVDVCTYRD